MKYVIAAILLAAPATADEICEDLWLSRNAIVDQAGYCFGSTLGDALFDNSNCVGADITLTGPEQQKVADIRAYEAEQACAVDTSASTLSLDDLDVRLRLISHPVRDISESSCIGWNGDQVLLYDGHYEGGRVTGSIEVGDIILSAHVAVTDAAGRVWVYYTAHDAGLTPSRVTAAGWTDMNLFENCDLVAG